MTSTENARRAGKVGGARMKDGRNGSHLHEWGPDPLCRRYVRICRRCARVEVREPPGFETYSGGTGSGAYWGLARFAGRCVGA